MNLSGNTILITGGSAGIGLTFAKKFRELGNEVIVTGRRLDKLEEAAAAIPGLHTIQSDAGSASDIAALASRIRKDFPKLNVLMNNAGILLYKNVAFPDADLEGLTVELDVNVAGPIRTVSALVDVAVAPPPLSDMLSRAITSGSETSTAMTARPRRVRRRRVRGTRATCGIVDAKRWS